MKKLLWLLVLVISLCVCACEVLPEDPGKDPVTDGDQGGEKEEEKVLPTSVTYVDGTAEKVVYQAGEPFDCTGAQVKVTYSDGSFKTVAVTAAMVGNAPLTFGTTSIGVTYTEGDTTLFTTIPISVTDPLAEVKALAIARMREHEDVLAHPTDAGVSLLLEDFVAQIETATTANAVAALEQAFDSELAEYLAAKAGILEELNAVDLSELYGSFRTDIDTAKATAITAIRAAATLEEANGYLETFKTAVQNKLAEQEALEDDGPGDDSGLIDDKIALLEELERYLAVITDFEQIVSDATDISELQKQAMLVYYSEVRSDIDYLQKYITLAMDLSAVDLEESIGSQLITEVDQVVDMILAADKITILPRAYDEGGCLQADDGTDVMRLLTYAEEKFATATTKFGRDGVEKLKARYGQPAGAVSDGDNFINLLLAKIRTKYDELNAIREAAEAAAIVDLIEAAAALDSTGVVGDAQDLAIRDAWAALQSWNAAYAVFTTVGTGEHVIAVEYDRQLRGVVYTATGFDVETQRWTTIDETWGEYDIDEAFVVTYLIPNIDQLIEASQERFAEQVKLAIMNEKLSPENICFSPDPDLDAENEIRAARTQYDAFVCAYSHAVADRYFKVGGEEIYLQRLEAAEERLADIKDKASDAVEAIDYYTRLVSDPSDIRPEDYAEEGALRIAYEKYLAFAFANGGNTEAICAYEVSLLSYLDWYRYSVYDEIIFVEVPKVINDARTARAERAMTDASAHPHFLNALSDFALEITGYVQCNYDYDPLPAGLVVGGVAMTADNAKLYFNEILIYNISAITDATQRVVETIALSVSHGPAGDETNFGLENPLLP